MHDNKKFIPIPLDPIDTWTKYQNFWTMGKAVNSAEFEMKQMTGLNPLYQGAETKIDLSYKPLGGNKK